MSAPAQRKVILSAVKHIEDKTCIRFYYRDRSTRDYVYITRGGGTWNSIKTMLIYLPKNAA